MPATIDFVNANLNGQNPAPPDFAGKLAWPVPILTLFVIVMLFSSLYAWCGNLIFGCDVAKGVSLNKARFLHVLKRIGPGIVSLFMIGIIELITLIPIIGWIIGLLLGPYFAVYQMMVLYHKGPFRSLIKSIEVMEGNFWRIFVGYWVLIFLSGLMCLTVIGVIWGLPFLVIGLGIINRDVIEKRKIS